MRTNRTFSVELSTIQRLKREVSTGYRSGFVNDAIKARLNNSEDFDITLVSARQRAASLLSCDEVPPSIKHLILEWLQERLQ